MMRKMTMRTKKRTKTRTTTRMRKINPMRRTIITKMLMRMRRFLQQSQINLSLILNQTLLLHQKRKLLQRLRSLNLQASFSPQDNFWTAILSGKKIQCLRIFSHPLKICSPSLISQCPFHHLCPIYSREVWAPSQIRANLQIIIMTIAADGVWLEEEVCSSGRLGNRISAII